MAFVTTNAFNGSIDTSPFILTPNGVEFVQIKTEGDLSVTQEITSVRPDYNRVQETNANN
jgi:hypothetical protein